LSAKQADGVLDQLGTLSGVDAVVMLGTGMPTLQPVLASNLAQRRVPVLSCMLALAWKSVEVIDPGKYPIQDWLSGKHWASRLESSQG
jgi:maleate isomerase